MALVFIVCLALSFTGLAQSRTLSMANRCAQGSKFEVYKDDQYMNTLHSIMGAKEKVPNLAACALLCMQAKGCQCAWYPKVGGPCMWRVDKCSTSELFTTATPTTRTTGLISICPVVKPASNGGSTSVTIVPTYGTCGGNNYQGSKCCGPNDHCVEQSEWYAQCLPKTEEKRAGWTGTILPAC